MNWFLLLTLLFTIVSTAMVLIILVQRPQGGGLASAFGGAGGGGTDTVFGGRVGDALTWATVIAFAVYLLIAATLNLMPVGRTIVPIVEPQGTGIGGTGTPAAEQVETMDPAGFPMPGDDTNP